MGNLIRNERLKLYKKLSTWILASIIVALSLLILAFSHWLRAGNSYVQTWEDWRRSYESDIEYYTMVLNEEPNNLDAAKEREVKMEQLRPVSKAEKIVFPIAVAIFVILLLPDTAPLIGMLMLGNLFRECGVTERLSDTAQNALCNIVTIFLGLAVGCKAAADTFLTWDTIKILILGLLAFMLSTVGGVLFGKVMYRISGGKINPLIGSAGVSAVPMAARVSQVEGQKANPANFLLMHAMGPNVAGVIGSAVAAGFFLKVFGG